MKEESVNPQEEGIVKESKAMEEFERARNENRILLHSVVGSQSYGTNVATSDTDYKFIYIDPIENLLTNNLSKEIRITDDYVGYEIGHFLHMLRKQGPNVIELFNTDPKFFTILHPAIKPLLEARNSFLTRQIAFSFGEYARSQIKKAHGTNKKFMQPMDKKRKSLIDFCWVATPNGSLLLLDWLESKDYPSWGVENDQAPFWIYGCSAIDHMKYTYNLYFDREEYDNYMLTQKNRNWAECNRLFSLRKYQGIVSSDDVQIKQSTVEKNEVPIISFYCNLDGFQKHCKDYKEYWEWVKKRNDQRFVENSSNEHNYDRKNMMHCVRLLNMAIEILRGEGVNVYRKDREELLAIRNGDMTYQFLVTLAESKSAEIKKLYDSTTLPDKCDKSIMDSYLLTLRKTIYEL